ncbi:hypothetical protein ACLOJK_000455 [Asimina triloba]
MASHHRRLATIVCTCRDQVELTQQGVRLSARTPASMPSNHSRSDVSAIYNICHAQPSPPTAALWAHQIFHHSQTCLSKGSSFHSPPSHLLTICGFHVLLDCPIDFSALSIFSPIPSPFSSPNQDASSFDSGEKSPSSEDHAQRKRRKVGNSLEAADLICAAPWYRTAKYLHFWDVSMIDVVLISSPMGMLGLPFLTRDCRFSAKIYATEVAARLGQLMMKDLVSMQDELSRFYGPGESASPEWMKPEELESLPFMLRKIAIGDDVVELGNWHPLYRFNRIT